MTRIVFVDDEVRVLDGLRRLLYPMRGDWQMSFVSSGTEALEIMAKYAFDAIVSDIRMPVMDGTELLSRVRNLYPGVVRIILSGQSDRDLTVKSAASAHQYLCKPCDAESLKLAVARAVNAKTTFDDPSVQALIAGAGSLPSIPSLYVDLLDKIQNPDGCLQDIANVITKDAAMTAKILQLSNSAFFGLRRHISDPREAVVYLGLDTLKALVLTAGVFSQFPVRTSSRFSISYLGNHTMMVGMLARKIAVAEGASRHQTEDSFVAGLLHDVGKLVLVTTYPERYETAMKLAEVEGVSLSAAEHKIFCTTHSQIGSCLLWLWGLPDGVVEAVAYHHCPDNCPARQFGPLAAVHAANVLAHESQPPGTGARAPELNMEYLGDLGLITRVPAWRILLEQAAREDRAA